MTLRELDKYYSNYPLAELRQAWRQNGKYNDPYFSVWITRIAWTICVCGIVSIILLIQFSKQRPTILPHFAAVHPLLFSCAVSLPLVSTFLGMILALIYRASTQQFIQDVQKAAYLIFSSYKSCHKEHVYVGDFNDWAMGAERVVQYIALQQVEGPTPNPNCGDLPYEECLVSAYTTFKHFGFLKGKLEKFYVVKSS